MLMNSFLLRIQYPLWNPLEYSGDTEAQVQYEASGSIYHLTMDVAANQSLIACSMLDYTLPLFFHGQSVKKYILIICCFFLSNQSNDTANHGQ